MTSNYRLIKYIPKDTLAKTDYCTTDIEDLTWIQEQLLRWTLQIAELDIHRDKLIKQTRTEMHEPDSNLPKSKAGPNSIASFISGTLENLMFNGQRDLTLKQMNALETISNIMAIFFPNNTAIRFQMGFDQ